MGVAKSGDECNRHSSGEAREKRSRRSRGIGLSGCDAESGHYVLALVGCSRAAGASFSSRLAREQRARVRRWWTLRPDVTSLVFASAYANPVSIPEAAPFVAHMERMSSGRLRLVSVYGWTNPHDRDEERTVLEDLTNGVADLACVGARAVGAALGIRSLEPLHAPLLFRDEQDVHQFVLSGRAEPLLAPLQEAGLVALALLPAGMRRPFGLTGPLVGPDDWKGKVIRTHASLTGEAALRALGATPVLRSSAELRAGPPVGIDGMDIDFQALAAWRYPGWLTCNVPLWPRLLLLVASQRRLARLSSADRSSAEGSHACSPCKERRHESMAAGKHAVGLGQARPGQRGRPGAPPPSISLCL